MPDVKTAIFFIKSGLKYFLTVSFNRKTLGSFKLFYFLKDLNRPESLFLLLVFSWK